MIGISISMKLLTVLMLACISKNPEVNMTFQEQQFAKQYGLNESDLADPHSILTAEGDRAYITDEEIELLKRVVMSEAGNQTVECQEAVATVILNRWQNPDKFPDTITGVINAAGQFSTRDNGEPTLSVEVAVFNALTYYNTYCQDIPSSVYYFRSGHYHDFGMPYCSFGDLYFSTDKDVVL